MLNIHELPKLDLHCHLDGSLSIPMMERHLGRAVAPAEVCVDSGCTSLTEYLTKFDIPVQCLQTALHLEEEAEAFLESLVPDHIRYVEVRFAPHALIKERPLLPRGHRKRAARPCARQRKDRYLFWRYHLRHAQFHAG